MSRLFLVAPGVHGDADEHQNHEEAENRSNGFHQSAPISVIRRSMRRCMTIQNFS
jgi:hypothetical protein